jgi:hypothetical protein
VACAISSANCMFMYYPAFGGGYLLQTGNRFSVHRPEP